MNTLVVIDDIRSAQDHAQHWLFKIAAPLWSSEGVCPDGFFAERLSLKGERVSMPRRLRVQARQIYSFATIGRLGWDGPWRKIVNRAVDLLVGRGRRTDGLFVHLFDDQGNVSDNRLDLYDHAFTLLALAHAGQVLDRPELFDIAGEIMDRLDVQWRRPEGGFWEGELTPCPPYRQNPHMHMFEAAIALRNATGQDRWTRLVAELGALFSKAFQHADTGAVTEYFDRDWHQLASDRGRIVEPGHCLEWAWLFEVGYPQSEGAPTAERLRDFALAHGICPTRGVAINEVDLDGILIDGSARLWPQTERLKAALARFRRLGEPRDEAEAAAAYRGLIPYLETPCPGVWRDRWLADGQWVDEDAPASSFYHIVCALGELLDCPR